MTTDGNMQYIRWPQGTSGPWVAKAFQTQQICQGPMWWIKRANVGGAIGVLQFSYDFTSPNATAWGATITASHVTFDQGNLLLPLGHTKTPPATPAQPDLPAEPFKFWQWPGITVDESTLVDGGTTSVIDRGSYDIVTDFGVVDSYTNDGHDDIIHFTNGTTITIVNATGVPATFVPFIIDHNGDTSGGAQTEAQAAAFMVLFTTYLSNHGYPVHSSSPLLLSVISSHTEDTGSTTTYHKAGSFITFFDLGLVASMPVPPLTVVNIDIDTERQTLSPQHLTWSAILSTWTPQATWPVDATNTPTWSGSPISIFEIDSRAGGESKLPESLAHFSIDMSTFAVTGSRTDL